MTAQKLCEKITYIPASSDPLSAEVFLLDTPCGLWAYDLGASFEAAEYLNSLSEFRAAVSHFHRDHAGNLSRVHPAELYGGGYFIKRAGRGIAVSGEMYIDGVRLFSVPSVHAKGSLGLEYGGLAFLGDSLYPGHRGYDIGILKSTINCLKSLSAERLVLSHEAPRLRNRGEEISRLEKIFSRRIKGENFIPAE